MFTFGVPVFSAGHEDNTVLDAVEHDGLVFGFALVLTKVMVLSIHNSNTSLLQETVIQGSPDVHANCDANRRTLEAWRGGFMKNYSLEIKTYVVVVHH